MMFYKQCPVCKKPEAFSDLDYKRYCDIFHDPGLFSINFKKSDFYCSKCKEYISVLSTLSFEKGSYGDIGGLCYQPLWYNPEENNLGSFHWIIKEIKYLDLSV